MKLHNNPLAHQNTPADYFLSWIKIESEKAKLVNALVECKQVTCKDGKGRITFKRLKQLHDLLNFASMRTSFHKAYFCLGFYDSGWLNGEVYLIPVHLLYEEILKRKTKASFNRNEVAVLFNEYILPIEKGILVFPKPWTE